MSKCICGNQKKRICFAIRLKQYIRCGIKIHTDDRCARTIPYDFKDIVEDVTSGKIGDLVVLL